MKRLCLVVADASRARIYTYEQLFEPDGPHDELREVLDLVELSRNQQARELFSDRSGGGHSGHHGFAYDDHRQGHVDHLDDNFAKQIAEGAGRITREHGCHDLVVVASSRIFGRLRAALATLSHTVTIIELERDFSKLATAELRDRLAELALLPPRPRLAAASR